MFVGFSFPGTLTSLALIDFGIQFLGWGIAVFFHTERLYDLTGSSTFLLVAGLCYKWHTNGHPRQLIQTGAVIVWALRLGSYLFSRILEQGQDRRFNKIRDDPVRFFSAWTMQGMWVFVTLLPTLLCVMNSRQPPLRLRDYIGWGVWLMGFLIETLADHQKTVFRRDPSNQGKFISSGLWSLSRHPNYFGEILLWFGLYISASSSFSGYEYFSVLSPTLVYLLITRVSGIPMLESYGLKKWGTSPLYQKYLRETPVLVPFWH
ncbi:Protein of unknown function DUF1295 [Trinorchestia longiramus]|nr:Protein of unknown function DUF1295 [Trinorchestia longiramus]